VREFVRRRQNPQQQHIQDRIFDVHTLAAPHSGSPHS
jgi:hypothetical protein